ncbi:MAG: hypothetical protein HYZ71_13995 [Deltaproteobacteria bacterium]|nr:hypothetical protein [Deltaproteobacteria bacterium]
MNPFALVLLAAGLTLHAEPYHQEKQFEKAETCKTCHKDQYQEWKGSMMHYSALSPTFQAFELTTRKLTGRFGPHDSQDPTFCINCHSPVGAYNNELAGLLREERSDTLLEKVAGQGISCTFCHSTQGPRKVDAPEKGHLGDGISNAALRFWPTDRLIGPTLGSPGPDTNSFHTEFGNNDVTSGYLRSSQFCGSCHDVRVPTPDKQTLAPFQRLENLFTEWEKGPYNTTQNPQGRVVSCQDCHMSLYGAKNPETGRPYPPGAYPVTKIATIDTKPRKHALHSFTAVSRALINDDLFPNQTKSTYDRFGFPIGQEQRRTQLLQMACKMEWGNTPSEWKGRPGTLPLEIIITNTGAGHNVPSGFSQERQLWIDLRVETELGENVYQSGFLVDRPHRDEPQGDESLHDEDLNAVNTLISTDTFEVTNETHGPDFNERPFNNRGLVEFNNAFLRKKGVGYERVHALFLADTMDNSRSLPILKPVSIKYDVPLSAFLHKYPNFAGHLRAIATLNFRSFPPKILRTLASREPDLISEDLVDRNRIVPIARIQKTITLSKLTVENSKSDHPHSFAFQNGAWISSLESLSWTEAKLNCQKHACQLPTANEYDSLGFKNYSPKAGDNIDELWKERWTGAQEKGEAQTHCLLSGETGLAPKALERPFFCHCPKKGVKS